jgi:hypothetical protein
MTLEQNGAYWNVDEGETSMGQSAAVIDIFKHRVRNTEIYY